MGQSQATCTRAPSSDLASPVRQNLNSVMVAMAELLSMKIPNSYEVLFSESPMRAAGPEAKKVETDGAGECQPPRGGGREGISPPAQGLLAGTRGAGSAPVTLLRSRPLSGTDKPGKPPDGSAEWLKQFDAVLPGYSLKSELDILTLLKQVSIP